MRTKLRVAIDTLPAGTRRSELHKLLTVFERLVDAAIHDDPIWVANECCSVAEIASALEHNQRQHAYMNPDPVASEAASRDAARLFGHRPAAEMKRRWVCCYVTHGPFPLKSCVVDGDTKPREFCAEHNEPWWGWVESKTNREARRVAMAFAGRKAYAPAAIMNAEEVA